MFYRIWQSVDELNTCLRRQSFITHRPVSSSTVVIPASSSPENNGIDSALRNDGDGWRPVRESLKHHYRLPPPTSAYYVELGGNKKFFRVDPSPSNKVEVFAPAPPSILGTFSGFGHDTVKSRHPAKHKNPFKDTFQQAESRPGYHTGLLTPPIRHAYSQPFKQNDNIGQAYYFEASLSPPPRDSAINFVPPPSSKGLAPNSYYLQFDQQTRAKPTSSSFSPYLRQSLPIYGAPDYFKANNPSTDSHKFYSQEPPSKLQFNSRPSNSHGRPPGIDYFGNNPFGDIHLNTNRPETKTPAKDIFDQLSHLGRPFQSTTIEPPRFSSVTSDYSTLTPLDYFPTSGNIHQTTPKPFRPSPLILDPYPSTEKPTMFVTPGPSIPPREVYPIPVTTLDIPSKDDLINNQSPFVNTYQPVPDTQQYTEEVTTKPITTTYYRRPEVEVNTHGQSYYQPTPFLPTPSTEDLPADSPAPTELVTPSSETNEVQKPVRTRVTRPRYRKKKPTRKPDSQYLVESTTEQHFETPLNEYTVTNGDEPNFTTFDTIQNNHETQREPENGNIRYEGKFKRRRPIRPINYQSTSTFTNVEPEIQEIPTEFSTVPEEEVKTTLPSTTTAFNKVQHRRRKKPISKTRGGTRHGLTRSTTTTTTTTTESPQELTSEVFSYTDYQNLKETTQTENYPFNGLAFNEYGHIMHTGTDEYSVNTLYPTQQVEEYQTDFHEHEVVTTTTTTTTEPTTTTTTTTTPVPETTTITTTSKPRIRNKYNYNNSRPRFSVKDYRERLKKATSTTEAPKEEVEEQNDTPRIRPPRLRGNISYKQSENTEEQTETSTRRFKPRYTGQRHAYRTSTTQSPLLQLDTPTSTERQNTFRPSSQRRPGSNKYYSRYRTSTEAPGSAEQPSTEKLPQRPKGVFSAKKRRPFPLRTRFEPPTQQGDNDAQVEVHSENPDAVLEHDQYITKKSDNVATTTLMTSSEEADWNVPSEASVKPELFTSNTVDQGEITKKIADLTSSPSNSFDSSGFFKGVSPSSRRTVSKITLATEDPILPIEAFFSSSLNRNADSR
ncbi:hypothetical protein J6590_024777 [Homalodisca vitripennis]|nr:hypothetical protein J6590_024777 [Homalodisca vitripennis]